MDEIVHQVHGEAATRHHGGRGKPHGTRCRTYATRRGDPASSNPLDPSAGGAWRHTTVAGAPSRLLALIAVALALAALVTILLAVAVRSAAAVAQPQGGFFARHPQARRRRRRVADAREASAENAAINRTLAYTPYVRIAGAQHREIALTFDDGPGPYTPQILAILQREHVPATFFEVGILERYFNASTTAIAADGDVIGDHTEVHAPMSRLSTEGATGAAARAGERDRALRGEASRGCSGPRTGCGTRTRSRCCTGTGC